MSDDSLNVFDQLANNSGGFQMVKEESVDVKRLQEVFKKMNAPKRQVKTYNVVVRQGDSYDGDDVRADEFYIAQGVLFFSRKDEIVYMVGVSNLISVDIETEEEDED